MTDKPLRLDEIGYWSEVKLDIVQRYASEYTKVLSKQASIRGFSYIDGFAGAGHHVSRSSGAQVAGSPVIAMKIAPAFSALYLVDLDGSRTRELKRLAEGDPRVQVHHGDGNQILLRDVFPKCLWEDRQRALCLLDPYKLNVNWEVLRTAGQMHSIEVFYNFMIMDANMNVFMRDPSKVSPEQAARMDAVWGDSTWRTAAYQSSQDLFGEIEEKATNEVIAEAFRKRLQEVAGFKYVPQPLPMRNSRGAVVYYLYFGSHNPAGDRIVTYIFDKYRNREA